MVAVVILTHNEEIHIERCLRAITPFASEIHIIDSGSTDRTVQIAKSFGANVLTRPFKNQADQFQWGLDTIATNADWIMRLDADEIIEPDLAARIATELPHLPADVVGITLDRKHIFMGRWIRHGGRYPLTLLRLFRRGQGRIEQRWMDEHLVVEGGRTAHFSGGFADHNLNDLSFFTAKHNRYATREAVDVLAQRHNLGPRDTSPQSLSRQAASRRWLKQSLYNRLPFTASATLYFLYRYIVQLGFLDGREGAIYHVLQGFWYRFLVGAKLLELERAIAPLKTPKEKRAALLRLTGLQLDTLSPTNPAVPETHQ